MDGDKIERHVVWHPTLPLGAIISADHSVTLFDYADEGARPSKLDMGSAALAGAFDARGRLAVAADRGLFVVENTSAGLHKTRIAEGAADVTRIVGAWIVLLPDGSITIIDDNERTQSIRLPHRVLQVVAKPNNHRFIAQTLESDLLLVETRPGPLDKRLNRYELLSRAPGRLVGLDLTQSGRLAAAWLSPGTTEVRVWELAPGTYQPARTSCGDSGIPGSRWGSCIDTSPIPVVRRSSALTAWLEWTGRVQFYSRSDNQAHDLPFPASTIAVDGTTVALGTTTGEIVITKLDHDALERPCDENTADAPIREIALDRGTIAARIGEDTLRMIHGQHCCEAVVDCRLGPSLIDGHAACAGSRAVYWVSSTCDVQQSPPPHVDTIGSPEPLTWPQPHLITLASNDTALLAYDEEAFIIHQNGDTTSLSDMTFHGRITTASWSTNTTMLAIGDRGGNIQIWNVTKGSHWASLHGFNEEITSISWSKDDRRVEAIGTHSRARWALDWRELCTNVTSARDGL
ncbi:MAG: hypothetical protein AAGF11_28610 [Myxococcota bacterium]